MALTITRQAIVHRCMDVATEWAQAYGLVITKPHGSITKAEAINDLLHRLDVEFSDLPATTPEQPNEPR